MKDIDCTGDAKVVGSNPVQSTNFFRSFFQQRHSCIRIFHSFKNEYVWRRSLVQKILSLPSFYSSTEALKELCWPTLSKHRLFHRCVFVYKYINSIIDFKFDTKLITDIHSYSTRGKSNFYLPRVRRNYGKQRLLYQGIAEWNSLDKSIRDMRSLLIFKQALKTAIF